MMYLYVGSIVAIMCIYITVLLDNCPSFGGGGSRSVKDLVNHDLGTHTDFSDSMTPI